MRGNPTVATDKWDGCGDAGPGSPSRSLVGVGWGGGEEGKKQRKSLPILCRFDPPSLNRLRSAYCVHATRKPEVSLQAR